MSVRQWRKFTWVIVGANLLLLVGFVILVVTAYSQPCDQHVYETVGNRHEWVAVCSTRNSNAAAAIIVYLVFWVFIAGVLFLVRYLTGRRRSTPAEFEGWQGQHVAGSHGVHPPPPPQASNGSAWAGSGRSEKEPD